jgi:hypothetical protein
LTPLARGVNKKSKLESIEQLDGRRNAWLGLAAVNAGCCHFYVASCSRWVVPSEVHNGVVFVALIIAMGCPASYVSGCLLAVQCQAARARGWLGSSKNNCHPGLLSSLQQVAGPHTNRCFTMAICIFKFWRKSKTKLISVLIF